MGHRFQGRSGALPSLIATAWAVLAPVLTVAQESPSFFLLDFDSDGFLLAESLPAYASDDTYLIDFVLFVEAVEFPIERSAQLWSGWFRSDDRQFSWRMDSGIVEVTGRDDARIENHEWMDADDGTYVSVEALERWFSLELDVDPRLQTVTVTSGEPLPFQIWRERTLAKYRHRSGERIEADVVVADQYRWATMPLFNLSTNVTARKQGDTRSAVGTTSLVMGMDLMKHSVVYTGSLIHSRQDQGNSTDSVNRLTIERAAVTQDDPLFAGVNRYIVGDIYQANANLVVDSRTGRGFSIDRYPNGRTGNLGYVTISGDAPPGWEVELYRNGTLIDFATVGADGRYFFPNQETPFGENTFVAKLFGPQGQTREDRQTFWGGGVELAKGDYDFSISHIDFDQTMLDGALDTDALPASYATDFRYARALTGDLQLGAAFTRTGLGSAASDGTFTDTQYLTLFGRIKLGPGVLIGEAVNQLDFGEAWSLEYLAGLYGQTISVAHRAFNDYESPATVHRNDLDSVNEISVYGSFSRNTPNGYTLRFRHRELTDGSSDFRIFNRLGWTLGGVSLSNELDHIVSSSPATTTGRLRLASRIKRVSLRGQLDYQITGDRPLKQIAATMNWDMARRLNNNLTITKNLSNDKLLYFTNMLSVRVRDWNLTLNLSSNLDDAWSVGAGFNLAFGYDQRRQKFVTDIRSLANTGRATMNLFMDDNNNGIRDPGEPPVPWAKYREQETLQVSPGALPLRALPNFRSVQIETRHFKFDDPFLVPRAKVYELRTHSGSDVSLDVAVLMTGDIEGHVFLGPADKAVAARGVIVSLRDERGYVIAQARSEFDGYYSFNSVPGGYYEVRVYEDEGRKEYVQPVTLDAQDGYIVVDRIYIDELMNGGAL